MTNEESLSDDTDDSSEWTVLMGDDPTRQLFDLLAVRRRRYLLYHLQRSADDSVDFDDAVEQVVEWERADEETLPEGDHRHDVAVTFHHAHIPKLVEAGAVEYDERSRTLRYCDAAAIERCLETIDEQVPE